MKKFAVSFCILLLSMCMFTACESNDDNEEICNYETVIINDDGSTSDGSVYSPIDMNSFYLDGVKYVIEDSKIIVSGYNEEVSLGDIKIPFAIKFRNVRYEVTQIADRAFANCSNLTSVTIPNSVTVIEDKAFSDCSELISVTLPNSLNKISDYMFVWCSNLTTVIIPKSVTCIGYAAFANCSSIKDVYCYAEQVPETDKTFDETTSEATLHVPSGSIEAYRSTTSWKTFGRIVALADDDPKPTGIISIVNDKLMNDNSIYDLQGNKLAQSKKGLNIIRTKEGKTKKVVVK